MPASILLRLGLYIACVTPLFLGVAILLFAFGTFNGNKTKDN